MTQSIMSGAATGALYVLMSIGFAFIKVKQPDGGYNTVYPKDFANVQLTPYQTQP